MILSQGLPAKFCQPSASRINQPSELIGIARALLAFIAQSRLNSGDERVGAHPLIGG